MSEGFSLSSIVERFHKPNSEIVPPPSTPEEAQERVAHYFKSKVARLTERQLHKVSLKREKYDSASKDMIEVDSGQSVADLVHELSMVKAGIDLSQMSVGELMSEELSTVFERNEDEYSQDRSDRLLRQKLRDSERSRQLHEAHAPGADPALLEDFKTRDPVGDFPITLSDEEIAQRVQRIDEIRTKWDKKMVVTERSVQELDKEWPEGRRRVVQRTFGFSDTEMAVLIKYKVNLDPQLSHQIVSYVAPILHDGKVRTELGLPNGPEDFVRIGVATDVTVEGYAVYTQAHLADGHKGLVAMSQDKTQTRYVLPRKRRSVFNQWALLGRIQADEELKSGRIPIENPQKPT